MIKLFATVRETTPAWVGPFGRPWVTVSVIAAAAWAATPVRASVITALPGNLTGVNDVTAVTTDTVAGTASVTAGVSGAGTGYSVFTPSDTYQITYAGLDEQVSTVTAGGRTYAATGLASGVEVRRSAGPDTDNLWYTGQESGTASGSTLSLFGPQLAGYAQVLAGNDVNVGADNLFSTHASGPLANPVGDNTDVARVDLIFAGGLQASADTAFVIGDRGSANDHDAFAIAAITGLDANGTPPDAYGAVLRFDDGTWGRTALDTAQEENVLRQEQVGTFDPLHPSDQVTQTFGGVAVTTAALAAGTGSATIYGYSLFSPDLTVTGDGSGTQLVDYADAAVYGRADYTSSGGGLDPVGTVAVLYTAAPVTVTAVPEPASAALAAAAAALALGRRRRRAV